MKTIEAVNNKVVEIDLTSGTIDVITVAENDRRQYLGGKGLALKMIYDRIKPGIDPLSAENILVLMSGPTTGTAAPTGGRYVIAAKSPLTGIFATSYLGGHFGVNLKRAGYDGVIIHGKAEIPSYINITNEGLSIEDASSLWGLDTYELQEKQMEKGHWAVIGPAGENLVRYAAVVSGNRIAGRCGMGAVMGSKNLKGLVANGKGRVVAKNTEGFKKATKIAQNKVKAHENTGVNMVELGTAQNVMIYGTSGIMPVKNYRKPYFDKIKNISAEKIRDEHFIKNHGCFGCSIKCGRLGDFDGKKRVSPEYETIALLGSNLEIDELPKIAEWNETLNRLGMDSISAGNTIGFAMELNEKGMLKSDLEFGKTGNIDSILEKIAYRKGLGDDLAEGVKRLSDKYGGKEFAIHVKGLELAAYDPRGCTGQGLGYATANCGATHLSGATHSVEVGSYLHSHGTRGKAHMVKMMQDVTDVANSSIFCIQAQYPFLEENPTYRNTPKFILKFVMRYLPAISAATIELSDFCSLVSGILGYEINHKEYYKIGERIFNLERLMNCREGIDSSDDTLPQRLLGEELIAGAPPIELGKMMMKYYKLRGWDNNGQPKPTTLERLDIAVH